MAVLEIRRAGDPVLKKVCEPVKRIDKKVKRILKDMADTLYKSGNGIGLAALCSALWSLTCRTETGCWS